MHVVQIVKCVRMVAVAKTVQSARRLDLHVAVLMVAVQKMRPVAQTLLRAVFPMQLAASFNWSAVASNFF